MRQQIKPTWRVHGIMFFKLFNLMFTLSNSNYKHYHLSQTVFICCYYKGIITNGGAKPNIIPEESEMEYYLRAPTQKELDELKQKATPCFEAAATSTGCRVSC